MPTILEERSVRDYERSHLSLILGMKAQTVPLSILIIDENRIRASVIEAGLRQAGYERLTIVHDVTGIARRIADMQPDVIVIDLGNPNRDMRNFCERLRSV